MSKNRFWYILAMILIFCMGFFNVALLHLSFGQSLLSLTLTIIYGGLMALSSKEK